MPKYLTRATGIDERGSKAEVYRIAAKCDYIGNFRILLNNAPLQMLLMCGCDIYIYTCIGNIIPLLSEAPPPKCRNKIGQFNISLAEDELMKESSPHQPDMEKTFSRST